MTHISQWLCKDTLSHYVIMLQ